MNHELTIRQRQEGPDELELRHLIGMDAWFAGTHADKPVVFREIAEPDGTLIREIDYYQGYGTR